jgi:5-methylcytosine-specific restriction enzyme A
MAVTQGHGNPDWTRDETILALDLYFTCEGKMPSSGDARVCELSKLLRSLPYHQTAHRNERFRNPAGVAFKLQNLHQVATGKGLGNVSKTDRMVWAELGSRRREVAQIAGLIRRSLSATIFGNHPIDDEEEEFFEGRLLTSLHKQKERHRNIRGKLLASRRKRGTLTCDMCCGQSISTDVKFEDATFEAHHKLPMSMATERKTKLKDMALLCANCHRLLHRAIVLNQRWLTIEEARRMVGLTLAPG